MEPTLNNSLQKKTKPLLIIEEDDDEPNNSFTTEELFWQNYSGKLNPTQIERYESQGSPEQIKRFIRIGGGPKMGVTLEEYARFKFTILKKREKGKNTGYDHKINMEAGEQEESIPFYVEQKSSGHWGTDDFKWQHVEIKHKWHILLLCGIGYQEVKFWLMNRTTFERLIHEKKITNQGNKENDSSEGMWFNYSDVKDSLTPVNTNEEIIQFINNI